VNCPSCGHENREGAQFCGECGRPLAAETGCPQCGSSNPVGQKFCDCCGSPLVELAEGRSERDPRDYTPKHLADKILHAKSALEGERKQVTVLFADVKGSMDLAEQVDPEEWHRILNRFFEILTDGVHRFEGTVNQYTGDGIMALFGAPIAHEDHAQRACYAAMHLSEELRRYANDLRLSKGLNFAVRMGLNSGEVVVGKIGDDLRMDYTAQGSTVGLAARMERIAEPGKVYLTENTAALVSGYFELEDLGQFEVPGARESVGVRELQGVGQLRTRLDLARARGFTRFVGRGREMATLESALAQAGEGCGQVVGVVGEAGVGKSRLCLEFVEGCRARDIRVLEAHCPAHGKTVPFLPLLQLLRSFFGISERDDDHEVRRKIVGELLLLDEAFQEMLPLVLDFLGVPDPDRPAPRMDPEARQRQLFAFVRKLVEARSAREAAVTLVDDLHWIDAGSDAFLAQIVEAVRGTRMLLLVNFRPEYHADWMQKSYYQQLPLLPLAPEAIQELLDDLLGRDPSVSALPELIRERTGGNPFFIEEIVESLAEGGSLAGTRGAYRRITPVESLEIPATVEVVLAARIDRLAEREKQVLQAASVIGKEFSEPVLARVVELPAPDLAGALALLKDAEFVHEQALYPVAEYAFKHPLTQEVALHSQLRERRARVHAAVARAIEETSPDKLDERAGLLAHHWEEAGEALEAARWHHRAGEWTGTSDPVRASGHWEGVRSLLREVPDSGEKDELELLACRHLLNMGWRLGLPASHTRQLFEEGTALAERAGDLRTRAILALLYGISRGTTGDIRAFLKWTPETVRLVRRIDDVGVQAAAWEQQIASLVFAADFRAALVLIDEALERFPHQPGLGIDVFGNSIYGLFHTWRGWSLYALGRLHEAGAEYKRALEVAGATRTPELACWVHTLLAERAYYAGDAERALEEARRAFELGQPLGGRALGIGTHALGFAHLTTGRWEEAVHAALSSVETLLEHEKGWGLGIAAEAYLGAGRLVEAEQRAEQAIALCRKSLRRQYEIDAHRVRALSVLRSQGAAARSEIETALAEAESLIEQTGAQVLAPRLHEARAEWARALGDEATRQRHLHEAHGLYTEMGATGHAERLARELGL